MEAVPEAVNRRIPGFAIKIPCVIMKQGCLSGLKRTGIMIEIIKG